MNSDDADDGGVSDAGRHWQDKRTLTELVAGGTGEKRRRQPKLDDLLTALGDSEIGDSIWCRGKVLMGSGPDRTF